MTAKPPPPQEAPALNWREEPKASDPQAVQELVQATGFFTAAETGIARELVETRLQQGPQSGYFFLFAEAATQLAAYVCHGPIPGTEGRFDLYWIATSPDFQGKGIGSQLLARVEALVAARDGRRIYIETSNKPLYTPTRGFYLKNGYRLEAQLKDYYRDGDDQMIYAKTL